MNIRVLFVVVVLAAPAVKIDAKSPFSFKPFRSIQRLANPKTTAFPAQAALKRLLNNPHEMTRRFGPSILAREGLANVRRSRFVRQPN